MSKPFLDDKEISDCYNIPVNKNPTVSWTDARRTIDRAIADTATREAIKWVIEECIGVNDADEGYIMAKFHLDTWEKMIDEEDKS